MLARLIDKLMA